MSLSDAQKVSVGVSMILAGIGENIEREGLKDTPQRAARAWREWTDGYGFSAIDIADMLKCFGDGAEGVDEMVVMSKIPFYSHCEHHLAPFFGEVDIGYLPSGRIVGLSKLVRLVRVFSRRLQVQERLTTDISQALSKALTPLGVGVVVRARHLCMESRGVCAAGTTTTTSSLLGAFRDRGVREEFLSLCTR